MSFSCRRLSRRLSHLCSARLSPLCSRRPLPLFPSSSPSVPVVSLSSLFLLPSFAYSLCSLPVDCLLPLFPSPSIAYSLCSRRRRLLTSILSSHSLCLFQMIVYASCLQGSDPVRLFDKRINAKRASKILELCILHLAMSEITVVGTRHQIVINEAIDLAKRFCDGAAPRIINGCLNTFIKGLIETKSPVEPKQQVSVEAVKSLT
ncbi:hypothetical protein ACFE04_014061 [Oxalis oulophora]